MPRACGDRVAGDRHRRQRRAPVRLRCRGEVAGHQPLPRRSAGSRRTRHAFHRRHRAVVRRACRDGASRSASPAPRARAPPPRCWRTCCARAAIAPRWPATSACRCWNCWMPTPEFWAIELSSYQTRDVAASGVRPEVAVVTNVFPEHLDWHGSEARYVDDKLALLTRREAADRGAQCQRSRGSRRWRCRTATCAGSAATTAGTCAATRCIAATHS